jgi:oxygen-dependent protoporphyrinogen oxidase
MIGFVAGAAVGYVLGTRAGRQRYEQIKAGAHRLWTSEPVQNKLDQAGHAVKTQALPFKVGDAVKAAGQAVKEKASAAPVPAKLRRGSDGSVVAEVTTAPHPAGSPSESSPTA